VVGLDRVDHGADAIHPLEIELHPEPLHRSGAVPRIRQAAERLESGVGVRERTWRERTWRERTWLLLSHGPQYSRLAVASIPEAPSRHES
jgi:hypothetical protein